MPMPFLAADYTLAAAVTPLFRCRCRHDADDDDLLTLPPPDDGDAAF